MLKEKEALDLTAKCYTVLDAETFRTIMSSKGKKVREMASLTKIMTCYIGCLYLSENKVDAKSIVKISKQASSMIGTSAELRSGE